ncbi:MAG: histidine--tRNA ligase [Gemmatimonadota bacterium]|nr:histidine--tRNA ligase [Gemmatimonadota bacterium]MDE3126850.1 histidine--tRNA ligase [Gemmatimonadota bacterium]
MAKGALPGFRDFYPQELAERAYLLRTWRDVARRFAFVEYDGPPLEPLELYTRKSGEEIVGQLYNFVDKGGREVALRPEMTPTFARMVADKANALRKPVRWFSVPQLFRYERQQKGRLREHFQLNVDLVGESDVTADAELLAVAVEIVRALGLTQNDVRARVSDRRLLRALLGALGVPEGQAPAVFGVIDKIERQPLEISREKLAALGLGQAAVDAIVGLTGRVSLERLRADYGTVPDVAERLADLERYFGYLRALGVGEWVDLDLKIVRGLAYYTGIVFELFDSHGEFRAICGGGRYDTLLESLGGVDLPALGFGMGDVVLGELLRKRGLMHAERSAADYWVAYSDPAQLGQAMELAGALRRGGASVEYALKAQQLGRQLKAAAAAGVPEAVIVREDHALILKSLASGEERTVRLREGRLV